MKSGPPIVQLLLTAVLLCSVAWGAQTADSLLQQAQAALEKKEYAEAGRALETYLAQNPQDYRARFNLAFAYSLTGRREDAIRLYREVLTSEKDLLAAHLNLGILLVEEGRGAEALEHLQLVGEKQPENFRAQFYLAQAFGGMKRLPEARKAYERAVRLKPEDAAAQLSYARLLADADPTAAESHLRRALQSDPSLDEARLLLASMLETQSKARSGSTPDEEALREAAELYRRVLDGHPERPDSKALRVHLGEIYAALNRDAEAIAQWEAARAAGDSSRELAQALLEAYLRNPQTGRDKAVALLQELLAQDGNNVEMRLLAGRLQMEKKQYAEASDQFRRAAELRPDSAEAHTNLASALYLVMDYDGTVAALAQVARLGKDTAGTYFLRAISLDKLHAVEPALENYQQFLALDGGKNPDQEFQARQRIRILTVELRNGRGKRR